jgi:hypothetical protein
MVLAIGPGYPSTFTASIAPALWGPCGMIDAEILLRELTGSSEAIETSLDGTTGAAFIAREVGTGSFTLGGELRVRGSGSCPLPVATGVPFEVKVYVSAIAAAEARVVPPGRCGTATEYAVAPSVTATGDALPAGFEVALFDDAGERKYVDNAEADAQVTVRLHGPFDAVYGMPRSLAQWIPPTQPGVVDVVPEFGTPLQIEVIEPGRITEAKLDFQVAGVGGNPSVVENGVAYGENGWGRTGNRLAPLVQTLRTAEGPLCTGPSPAWFAFESLTPDVCTVIPLSLSPAEDSYLLYGDRIGQAARFVGDGTCSLEVRAPEFMADAGLPVSLAADFRNVDQLHEFE